MTVFNDTQKKDSFSEKFNKLFSEFELANFENICIKNSIEIPKFIRIGNATMKNFEKVSYPLLIPFRELSCLAIETDKSDSNNSQFFIQLIAIRIMCYLSPAISKFQFIDINRFGASFPFVTGISDYNYNFVTDEHELEQFLNEYIEIIKKIINKNLTYKFKNITDYNKYSGLSEPYHFIFIADFPTGFNMSRINTLNKIIQNASKCGIYVFITYYRNSSQYSYSNIVEDIAEQLICSMPLIERIDFSSCKFRNIDYISELENQFNIKLDGVHNHIDIAIIEKLILKLNKTIEINKKEELKEGGIRIPIGKNGHNNHYFTLGCGSNVYHALIGGQTGWGKTVLLHNIIINSIRLYTPNELQLWLMDYKEGTEFNVYHNHPSVTYISVENSIDEGIEILEKLQHIITERGKLFKIKNVSNITRYNKISDKMIPRILLIIDEFQKLLELNNRQNFKIVTKINMLLEDVAKRGRSFGIHLILCSQSLLDIELKRGIRNQFGLRIVFKIHKSECPKFFDYNNEIPAYLTQKGEAVYNTDNGQPRSNVTIRINYINESEIPMLINEKNQI